MHPSRHPTYRSSTKLAEFWWIQNFSHGHQAKHMKIKKLEKTHLFRPELSKFAKSFLSILTNMKYTCRISENYICFKKIPVLKHLKYSSLGDLLYNIAIVPSFLIIWRMAM